MRALRSSLFSWGRTTGNVQPSVRLFATLRPCPRPRPSTPLFSGLAQRRTYSDVDEKEADEALVELTEKSPSLARLVRLGSAAVKEEERLVPSIVGRDLRENEVAYARYLTRLLDAALPERVIAAYETFGPLNVVGGTAEQVPPPLPLPPISCGWDSSDRCMCVRWCSVRVTCSVWSRCCCGHKGSTRQQGVRTSPSSCR